MKTLTKYVYQFSKTAISVQCMLDQKLVCKPQL